jgi:hypothetical protein
MAFKRKPPADDVRRVISLGGNFRGVTTNKRGQLVQFESEQERKLLLLLERDPTVADFRSQPERLSFCDAAGRQHSYTPDFKVWRTDGAIELHEVTLAARLAERAALQQRTAAAQAICGARGWRYVVHTDHTLPSGYEYANLDFLSAFRATTHATTENTLWWWQQLHNQQPVYPGTVLAQAGADLAPPLLVNSLYHQLWHGVVQMDWRQPFIWQGAFHPAARIWLATPTMDAPQAVTRLATASAQAVQP